MKTKSLIALLGILPASFINAQFATSFSAAEAYNNGPLNDHPYWSVFDGSGNDPNAYTVDVSGSGVLIIDPSVTNFQAATYVGSGTPFTTNTYSGEAILTLNYTNGTTSMVASGALAMPNFEISNAVTTTEVAVFALRHISPDGTNGNRFNIFSLNRFNGQNDPGGNFSTIVEGTSMGLAIDEAGNWTDGQSDNLRLAFSLVHLGANLWKESVTLTNVDTAVELVSLSRTLTDTDGSFAANENRIRMYGGNLATMALAIKIDSLSLSTSLDPAADWEWFGLVSPQNETFYKHPEHGWMYVHTLSQDGFWFYDFGASGWVWTSKDLYPIVYLHGAGWLYYIEGTVSPERWFYSYSQVNWLFEGNFSAGE